MEGEEEKEETIKLNNLPKDIIFDIFSRIPLKNLCQIRCVCKKWLILLSLNQEFTSFYHMKHKTSPLLMFIKQNNETPSTQILSYFIDGTQQPQFSTIFTNIQSSFILTSNGIICLISKEKLILHDPISKHVTNLPNTSHFISSVSFAFGHVTCSFRNVYKLIHFYMVEKFDNFHYCQRKMIMCEVLTLPRFDIGSSDQMQWRSLGKCPYNNVLGRKDHASVGQKIYWLIGEDKFNLDDIKIMSFHLESEVFGLVFFPRTCSNRSIECLDLIQIQEKLCLIDRLPWESTMDIWMMISEDDFIANNWCKKYRIDLMGINHHDVRIMGYLNKINNSGNGDFKEEILIKFGSKKYGVYDLDNGLFRDFGCGINFDGWDFNLFVDRKHLL